MSLALNDASLESLPYIIHAIKTEHILEVMMQATDLRKEIPIVIINVTDNGVVGRVSIPLKYGNDDFRAKHIGDAFIEQFDGTCIHDGTRYDTSVCDFRLNRKLVSDNRLKSVFEKVEQLMKKLLNI